MKMQTSATAFLLVLGLCVTSACFVRNCPNGGKRALPLNSSIRHRQCLACDAVIYGRPVEGVCISPDTCCISNLGCLVNTTESKTCVLENYLSTPCHNPGPSCGVEFQGTCVVKGICCVDNNCEFDTQCQ